MLWPLQAHQVGAACEVIRCCVTFCPPSTPCVSLCAGKETDGFFLLEYCGSTLLDLMQRTNFQLVSIHMLTRQQLCVHMWVADVPRIRVWPSTYVQDDFVVYEVFSEVCQGVAHMHRQPVPWAHRDIKAENVLRNGEGRWVLCDFGSSTQRAQVYETPAEIAMEVGKHASGCQHPCIVSTATSSSMLVCLLLMWLQEEIIRRTTTPAYRAPEMWDLMGRQRIDTKADIWVGIMQHSQ
jgi:AP2-associated kinase